jgi:hypothetical protein
MNRLMTLKKFRKNENGQSLVELALTIPVLILLLCAIVDFGWIFSNKIVLSYCSREGARYGAVNASQADPGLEVVSRVILIAPEYLRPDLSVFVTYTDTYRIRSGDIEVEVRCMLNSLTPIAGIVFGGQRIEIASTCVMKVE